MGMNKHTNTNPAIKQPIFHLRNRDFLLLDILLLAVIPVMALTLRVNLPWGNVYIQAIQIFTLLAIIIKLPIFYFFGLYRRYWRYASMDEVLTIALSVFICTGLVTAVAWGLRGFGLFNDSVLPRSVPIIDGLLTLIFIGGTRFSLRAVEYWQMRRTNGSRGRRVLIAGAGDAGEIVVREMRNSRQLVMEPVGFVDDNPQKQGVFIHGLRVLGSVDRIPELVEKFRVEEVIVAMPTAPGATIRQILRLCEEAGVPSKSVPGIFELLDGKIKLNRLRGINIEDLLRREPVVVNADKVADLLTGKRVLVTGAGGSIGTELCMQIARAQPSQLIALGHGENSLFQLSAQLKKLSTGEKDQKQPRYEFVVADVRDRKRLESIFTSFVPQIVFHAAAHKHVHLMEENIADAVTNNVMGTFNLLELSKQHAVEHFVMISTDKEIGRAHV